MDLGMVGLGRMGANMVERLRAGGHRVTGYDRNPAVSQAADLAALVAQIPARRTLWVMVPAGEPTDATIEELSTLLAVDDLVVDGGNTYFRDSLRHHGVLASRGIRFMDVGTSGGIWGLKEGYCLMAGGTAEDFARIEPLLATLAAPEGYAHVGQVGAGHYAKMVHNGIEYALLQAYAEGFELMKTSPFAPDLAKLAQLWNHGSVIRSWMLELATLALQEDPDFSHIKGYVEDSGEGRWTVQEAIHQDVPAPVIALSLFARFASRQEDSFAMKFIAALRNEFGGHSVRPVS